MGKIKFLPLVNHRGGIDFSNFQQNSFFDPLFGIDPEIFQKYPGHFTSARPAENCRSCVFHAQQYRGTDRSGNS